jgi:hypothetical protein
MPVALVFALIATVVLLGTMAYFLMGSAPLLLLRHESPVDALVVRGYFDASYRCTAAAALGAAVAFAFTRHTGLAAGGVALVVASLALRRAVVPGLDALRGRLQAGEAGAVRAFRRRHAAAIGANLVVLIATVATLVAARVELG